MGNVMGGIAEALIATAVGILVALPAVIFYNVFQKKGSDIEEQAARAGQRCRVDERRACAAHARATDGARRRGAPPTAATAAPPGWRPDMAGTMAGGRGRARTIAAINVTPAGRRRPGAAGHPDGRVDVHRGADAEGAAAARQVDRRHGREAHQGRALEGRQAALERAAGRRSRAAGQDEGGRRRRPRDEPGGQRRQGGSARQRRPRAGHGQAGGRSRSSRSTSSRADE